MPWLEKRGKRYRINLDYDGQHLSRSLKTGERREAEACLKRVEANLHEVERGRKKIPPGADLVLFLLSDGELTGEQTVEKPLTLSDLFARYEQLPDGFKEANTRYTERIHIEHLKRLMGSRMPVRSITTEALQGYVDARSCEDGRNGEPVSHATVKKEVSTLSSIWNRLSQVHGLALGPAPTKGLVYRKAKSKPPFQTWPQVERQIARGGLSKAQEKVLWDCLFLSLAEIDEFLKFIRENYRPRFAQLMFVFAAHTGARRSEILRSELEDFDLGSGMVTIREKKKDRSKEMTFRHVPMSPLLREAVLAWKAEHPGGHLTICQEANKPLSVQLAAHHFRWAVEGSKWDKLRGWHVFRHSFASNCALKGIDQRIIDAWMGHQTEDMRKRYRHLFPDQQMQAINLVFGKGA